MYTRDRSTTFVKLGADVTVVEMLGDILPGYKSGVAHVVRKCTEELGIDMHLGEGASDWRKEDDGIMVTTETEDGEKNEYRVDKVLVAVGRSPVTDTMDIKNTGLEADDRGFLSVSDRRRTDVEYIYVVGDVAEGTPMLAHATSKEGIAAAEHVAGELVAFDSQAVLAAVFTDPEIGTVGMTETDTEEAGFTPIVGQIPFRASDRMLTTNHADGSARVVADKESGFALRAQIVDPEASELATGLVFAIEMGVTLEDVAPTIHTRLTFAETTMEATENALGQAIRTLNR